MNPPLPPPPEPQWLPPMPAGPAVASWRKRPRDLPTWRTTSPGWVVLHAVLGVAIGFGASMLEVLFASGWIPITQMQTATDDQKATVGGMVLLAWVAGLLTWMLFVYLRPLVWRLIAFPGVLSLVTILGTLAVVNGFRGA